MSTNSNTHSVNTSSGLPDEVEKLKEIFPQFVKDGKIDFDALKSWFSEKGQLPENDEKYNLGWAGRSKAIQATRTPATGTLKPSKEESKDWSTTQNLFIEGDNLEALKLLQRQYAGKIKMIYIDPPYNTGKDFVYSDKFSEGVSDYYDRYGKTSTSEETKNQQAGERYHSNWLTMMYPRLYLAKTLLRDDGLIFINIDDNEAFNLKLLMDEIFGESNFIADLIWEKRFTRSNDAKLMASLYDHTLMYRKSEQLSQLREERTEKADSIYSNPDNDPRGPWTSVSYVSQRTKDQRPNLSYPVENPNNGQIVEHPTNAWKFGKEQYEKHLSLKALYWGKDGNNKYPRLKKYLSEVSENGMVPINLWNYKDSGSIDQGTKEVDELMGKDLFDYPKPTKLIRRMISMSCTQGDETVLDFFSGSSTTADAVMRHNAANGTAVKHIQIQLPEVVESNSVASKAGYETVADIAKERIRRASDMIKQDFNTELSNRKDRFDVGFKVFKLTPSNYRRWHLVDNDENAENKVKDQARLIADNPLVDGADNESVIYEVALKEGFDISTDPESVQLGTMKCSVFADTDSDRKLYVTLDDEVDDRAVIEARLKQNDVFVCLDNSFKSSSQKLNLTENGVNLKVI